MQKQKGFSIVFLAVIVAIVAGIVVGGMTAYRQLRYGKNQGQAQYQSQDQANQPPAQQPPQADQTANWKTYRNDEYGFELQYPPELTTEKYGSGVAFVIPSDHDQVFYITNDTLALGGNGKYQNAVLDFDGIYRRQSETFTKEEVSVAGIKSTKFSGIIPFFGQVQKEGFAQARAKEVNILVPKKVGNNQLCPTASDCGADDFFGIHWSSGNYFPNRNYGDGEMISDHDENQFNKILATFKFTK